MSASQVQNKVYFLPDLGDLIFVLLLYLLLYLRPDLIFTDGSTAQHLAIGNYILQHHQMPQGDILSYTFAGKPWVAYEWLSGVIMAGLVNWGGLNLLAIVVSCMIAFLFFLLYYCCRESGCNFLMASLSHDSGRPVIGNSMVSAPAFIYLFWPADFCHTAGSLLQRWYEQETIGHLSNFVYVVMDQLSSRFHSWFGLDWYLSFLRDRRVFI